MSSGWKREPARHSLAGRGVRTSPRKSAYRKPKRFESLTTYTARFPYWTNSFITALRAGEPDIAWKVLADNNPSFRKAKDSVIGWGVLLPTATYTVWNDRGKYKVHVAFVDEDGAHLDSFASREYDSLGDAVDYAQEMQKWSKLVLMAHDMVESTVLGKEMEIGGEPVGGIGPIDGESARRYLEMYEELKGTMEKVPRYVRPYFDRMEVGTVEIIKEDLR